MKVDIITNSLRTLLEAFDRGMGYLDPYADSLLYSLMIIQVVFLGLKVAMDDTNQRIYPNFMMAFFLLFWGWFTMNFHDLAKSFVNSMIAAGEIAGGGTAPCGIANPSCIIGYGFVALENLEVVVANSKLDIMDSLVMGLTKLMIIISYVIIALQGAIALLEYYFFLIISGFLMPWGVLEKTRFLSEKAIGAIVGCAVKLMAITFILAVIEPTIQTFRIEGINGKVSWNEVMSFLCTMFFFAWLAWVVPNKAQGYLTGSPSLSLAGLTQNAVSGARGGTTITTNSLNVITKGGGALLSAGSNGARAAAAAVGTIRK
jgi:type IV secretion system protein TrbL